MASNFLTYKKFSTSEQASELIGILNQSEIPFEMEDHSGHMPDIYVGQNFNNDIIVKIHPDDFLKVNSLLDEKAASLIDTVSKDYYLFSFDNDELIEVVSEPDKWCELDKQLAKHILNSKGIMVTKELEDALYKKRIKELSTEEKGSTLWTTVGYISAFLGGILGIAIGLNLWTSKRTLPDGSRVFIYTEKDRKHGQYITLIGIVMLCYWFYLQMKYSFFNRIF